MNVELLMFVLGMATGFLIWSFSDNGGNAEGGAA